MSEILQRMSTGAPTLRHATPADDAARDAFVLAHPAGTPFHLAGWKRAVERSFGQRSYDLLALRDGAIVGLLPLTRCRGLGGKSHLISAPWAVYGGPLSHEPAVESALVEEAKRLAETLKVGRLELRVREALPAEYGLATSSLYETYVCDLPSDPEEVMARMPKRSCAEVRKARDRFGLELVEGDEHADKLVELFHRSKQNLGSPGLPARWFRALREELPPGSVAYHAARREGGTIAVLMSFVFSGTVYVYYIGLADGANREYSATNYSCAGIQEWGVRRGLTRFDLGRSRADSGAAAFKRNQGLTAKPLPYAFHLVRSKELPAFHPSNPRTEVLQKAWRKLPPFAARGLSSVLSRYLP